MRLSELSNFPTPWASNFQTPSSQTFELEPGVCSVNRYAFSGGPSPCSLAQRVATASNFQAGFPFKLSISRPLSSSKLSNFQASNSSFSKVFSNSPISSNIWYVQSLNNSSSKNPTRDTSRIFSHGPGISPIAQNFRSVFGSLGFGSGLVMVI